MPTVENGISRRNFLTTLPAFALAIPHLASGERKDNRTLQQIESDWRERLMLGKVQVEEGAAFDAQGRLLFYVTGNEYGISLTDKQRHQIMGQTWSHFHLPSIKGYQTVPMVDFFDGRFGYFNSLRQVREVSYDPETKRNFLSWVSEGNRVWWPDVPIKNMEWQVDQELKTIHDGTALDQNIESYRRVWQRWADGNHAEFHFEVHT
jgi:hypothetical protein